MLTKVILLPLLLLLCLQGLLFHVFWYFPDSWSFFRKKMLKFSQIYLLIAIKTVMFN